MCQGISIFKGCGNCMFYPCDLKLLQKLDILSVIRLCIILLWHPNITDTNKYAINNLTVNCSGIVFYNSLQKDTSTNSILCSNILTIWYRIHPNDKTRLPYTILVNTAEKIRSIKSIHKLRTEMLSLEKYTESIVVCSKSCKNITINKEYSNCIYKLCDINTKILCNEKQLVYILCTILTNINLENEKSLTVDDTKLLIYCNGSIVLQKGYIFKDDALNHTKTICIKLLRAWCSRNISNALLILVIYKTIDKINNCNTVLEIYNCIKQIQN